MLNPIPLPQLETGNHLSYGLQWILFGFLAPAGLLYFLFAETRERRRFAQEQDELDEPAAPPSQAQPVDQAPRSRYGHTRRNPWAQAYDRQQDRVR